MKHILVTFLLLGMIELLGFEIKSVDLTKDGIEKENLPYTIAKDNKKIYKNISSTISALKSKILKPISIVPTYPIASNTIDKKLSTHLDTKKKIDTKAKKDISDVFTDLNGKDNAKIEDINKKNDQIKLDEKMSRVNPINLEK